MVEYWGYYADRPNSSQPGRRLFLRLQDAPLPRPPNHWLLFTRFLPIRREEAARLQMDVFRSTLGGSHAMGSQEKAVGPRAKARCRNLKWRTITLAWAIVVQAFHHFFGKSDEEDLLQSYRLLVAVG